MSQSTSYRFIWLYACKNIHINSHNLLHFRANFYKILIESGCAIVSSITCDSRKNKPLISLSIHRLWHSLLPLPPGTIHTPLLPLFICYKAHHFLYTVAHLTFIQYGWFHNHQAKSWNPSNPREFPFPSSPPGISQAHTLIGSTTPSPPPRTAQKKL